jgi:predicted 3-demethylubiquinone-9 3-methyltransferase (glyoxalase superfamily)
MMLTLDEDIIIIIGVRRMLVPANCGGSRMNLRLATVVLLAAVIGCSEGGDSNQPVNQQSKGANLVDSGPKITTFLMFEGKAEEAMNFYVSLFEGSKVVNVTRYGPGEMGKEGSVQHAVFSLNGREFMCIDSPAKHDFTFTPAISLYVSCPDEAKITRYFQALSEGGNVLMPLDSYPFSKKFAWVQDRFGVSWQLSAS